MDKVKWGIMGTDNLAQQFAESVAPESAELTAVSSRTLQKAFDFSEKYALKKAYGSHEELAYDPEIHSVFIAVPDSILKHTILMALKAKKHVVCIKLTSLNPQDREEVFKLADKKKRFVSDSIDLSTL